MKKFLLKICVLVVLVVAITVPALHGVMAAEETGDAAPAANPYDDLNLDDDDIVEKYHKDMNDLFNENIKLMVGKLDAEAAMTGGEVDEKDKAIFEAPDTDEVCLDPAVQNVSTYCVAVRATKKFLLYQEALNKRKSYIAAVTGDELMQNLSELLSTAREENYSNDELAEEIADLLYIPKIRILRALESAESELITEQYIVEALRADTQASIQNTISERVSAINEELIKAQKVMDSALQAYNEFRLAYPLHVQYQRLIPTLQKYRDALNVIRDKVETFPSKFVDATSSTCT